MLSWTGSTPYCGGGVRGHEKGKLATDRWAGYFRHGNSSKKFAIVNSYVHQRMAILASNKHGMSGRNWATRFDYGWLTSLGIYRLSGTVDYRTAHAQR